MRKLELHGRRDLDTLPRLSALPREHVERMKAVAAVLPFRVNDYVIEELIDWSNIPEDPIFQLTFPQPGMLEPDDEERVRSLMSREAHPEEIRAEADRIRWKLNPHPAGQKRLNVPKVDGIEVRGVQRKYRETCLVFPSQGQTCHAYCSFCFRWPQFVGIKSLKFATEQAMSFGSFIAKEKDLTDVLLTGGDPMIMSAAHLERYVSVFLGADFEHIQTIRIGTKSLSYWPHRFVTDPDADAVLRIFERVVAAKKHLALMAHFSHERELAPELAREAIRRIRATGAEIRTQSPVIRHVNDDSESWARMWNLQVRLGLVPYYMFIERDTGAKDYFALPLVRALEIYRGAMTHVSGLGRTARGPVMSSLPGKIQIDGIAEINGEAVFVLDFLQGRNPDWVRRPFFAKLDEQAVWFDELTPAFGAQRFFFQDELGAMIGRAA